MKKKTIEIVIIVTIVITMAVLYIIKGTGNIFQSDNNEESKQQEQVATIKARDGILGVKQPSPFIVDAKAVENNIFENANGSFIGQYIYMQRSQLPIAEQKLFVNNKDTTNYILGYLANKQSTNFEYGETVELKRNYPYYIQWDRRWAYDKLGGTNIAIGGCGPTVVAMAFSGLLNDSSITPKQISEIEDNNGYFTDAGTKWSFFEFIAQQYGLKVNGVSINKNEIDKVLDKGNPIIVSVHPGKFTTVGHIILIAGKDSSGQYIINDPNSYTRTLKKWSYDELKTEIVAMWEVSK